MALLYEIIEHRKDGHKLACITGYEGKISELIIPETIDGNRVEAIGNHAFSGRDDIVFVSIPESVRTLYGFAFHNCKNLRKIAIFDSIDDYYDGVCRQCDNLEEVEITVNNSWYEVIRNFLADNDKTLKFLIHSKTESENYVDSALTFPEYVYDFNENTMARTIQFSIAGSGYAFRECVDRRRIDFRQYDSLFEKAIIDGSEIAQDIALGRLLYPVELEDRYRAGYEKYITDNGYKVLERLIRRCTDSFSQGKEINKLKSLLSYNQAAQSANNNLENKTENGLFSDGVLEKIMILLSEVNKPELTAVFMDMGKNAVNISNEFEF